MARGSRMCSFRVNPDAGYDRLVENERTAKNYVSFSERAKRDIISGKLSDGTRSLLNNMKILLVSYNKYRPTISSRTPESCIMACQSRISMWHTMEKCGVPSLTDDYTANVCIHEIKTEFIKCRQQCKELEESLSTFRHECNKREEQKKVSPEEHRDFDYFQVECKDGKCNIIKCNATRCRSIVVDRDDFDGCDPEGSGVCINKDHCDYDAGVCVADTTFFQ